MNNLFLNTLNASFGAILSVSESTPLPVVLYAIILLATEYFKYKRSKTDK